MLTNWYTRHFFFKKNLAAGLRIKDVLPAGTSTTDHGQVKAPYEHRSFDYRQKFTFLQ